MDINTVKAKNKAALARDPHAWQVVRRKKAFPQQWKQAQDILPPTKPPRSNIYIPFQTYAQVTAGPARTTPSPSPSPPSSPTSQTSPKFYVSPHSPTSLRFPPSHHFVEWKGRCFRCCRTGHNQASCRNQTKCGKCWKSGHTGNKCRAKTLNPAARPYFPDPKPATLGEPDFGELLKGPRPVKPMPMPPNRPRKIMSYVERDGEFLQEMSRLRQAVVVHYPHSLAFDISIDKVTEIAVSTKLVTQHEITVAKVKKNKFLINLPRGLAAETFVAATPPEIWDDGFIFQRWNPVEDTNPWVPEFKVLLNLHGVPQCCYREREVSRAVSNFGVFLGTVAQCESHDISTWTVVVGTKELEEVPYTVGMVVGGVEHEVEVQPIKWERGRIYSDDELLKPPEPFCRPVKPVEETLLIQNPTPEYDGEEDGRIKVSRKFIMEICEGRDLQTLPEEIRAILAGGEPTLKSIQSTTETIPHQQQQGLVTADPNTEHLVEGGTETELLQQVKLKSIICAPQIILLRSPNKEVSIVQPTCLQNQSPRIGQGPLNTQPEGNRDGLSAAGFSQAQPLIATQEAPGVGTLDPNPNDTTFVSPMPERYVATENTPREETVEREAPLEIDPIRYAETEADTPVLSPIANTRLSPQRRKKLKGKGALKDNRNRPNRKEVGSSSNHGPTNKPDHGAAQYAQAKKGEDGLYEVHIEFSEAKRLADLIGVHQRDVIQVVLEDNSERKVIETQSHPEEENQDTTEGGGEGDQRVNLDPDSDEELESDLD